VVTAIQHYCLVQLPQARGVVSRTWSPGRVKVTANNGNPLHANPGGLISLRTKQHLSPTSPSPPPSFVNYFLFNPLIIEQSAISNLSIATLLTRASPTFFNMEGDKNIEMVGIEERNSSKEGSVENGVVKPNTDVSSEKGILDVCLIFENNWTNSEFC
jgi:hypothetical protein